MKKNFRLISFLTALTVFLQVNTPYIALAQQFILPPSPSLVPLSGNFTVGTRDIRPILDIDLARIPSTSNVFLRKTLVDGINSGSDLRSSVPSSVSHAVIYDKNSNLTKHTRPNLKVINYAYDALNRLTGKTYPQNTPLNTTYVYDLASRLTDANNAANAIHYVFDALNRVTSETQTINAIVYTLGYQYDKVGNRTKLTYPSSGKVVDYVYDANDRLDIIKRNGVNLVDYNYDQLNRRISRSLITSLLPLTTYVYDLANQLSSVTNKLVNNTAVSVYAYPTYDLVGNRTRMDRTFQANPVQTTNYTYNNIYELVSTTGAQVHTFDYDAVANREVADGVTYVSNNLNQYTSVGGASKTYELNGNLTVDGAKTFAYDEENRLSLATVSGVTSTYQYDGFGRRVAKTVNGITTYFIFDRDDVIQDRTSAGALTAEYIHGPNIDEVLSMERGANTYYYHHDGLGSVSEITNSSGAVVENYTYDVYGQPSVVNSTISNRYRFTGREFDEETGLYHYRARAYSPTMGRFLQRDPIGYWDSMNLYQYAFNSSINYIDPYGENAWDLVDIGFFLDSVNKFTKCKTWGNAGSLLLDTISLLPIIPSLGYLTRADDVADLFKAENLVIGRGKDLQKLKPGEFKLEWPSKLPNFKAEWKINSGKLREHMRKGRPIRDASPGDKGGAFLNAERNLLRDKGWTFNPNTGHWNPPSR